MSSTATAAGQEGIRLRRNALSLRHIVASTLANIAPAMSFFFGFAVIVEGAGLAAPLTILTAMVAILFLTNTLAEFTRLTPSTGSFVTFTGKAFGPAFGAAISIFVTFGYIIAASTVVAVAGSWASDTLQDFLGLSVHWAVLTVTISVVVGWLVMRGISPSTLWAGIFFYFEAALLILGAILMIAAHPDAISFAPFRPANLTGGWAGLGAGFPLAIYLFIGWENSTMLAEETADPRRNIPRALITSTLSIGVFYVILAFATTVGFQMDAKAISGASIPFIDALKGASPGLLIVAYLAGITSIVSSLIGLVNSQARILFNSGREGLLPRFFGKIHPQHQTPHSAMWGFLIIALALVLGFGLLYHVAPLDYFGFAGTLGAIPIILTYLFTNLALPIYVWKHKRNELNVRSHIILPLLGSLALLLPLWGLIQPGQAWPLKAFPWVALGALVVAGVYGAVLARRSPDLVHRIGAYVADE